ncbi:hypothetical protein [Duganella lactea]|uniref:hypothetical protein n=1 Tax=Duganella lactea TaxID=2692173 RepID=UPI0019251FFB|nr:hypothetical protein [Duganella lactea]
MKVVARLLAAVLGGYALASLCAALLAFALPLAFGLTLADGVVIGSMLGFVVHAAWFVWAFSPVSAGRVWLVLAAALCLTAALLWAAGGNPWSPPAAA